MKRAISLILALVMLAGVTPIPAMAGEVSETAAAQETTAEAQESTQTQQTEEPPAITETVPETTAQATEEIPTQAAEETVPPTTEETQPSETAETLPGETVAEEPREPELLTWEDYRYTLLADGMASVCGFTGTAEDGDKPFLVEIPSDIQGVAITELGERAFAENTEIDGILLPETIRTVGDGAFEACENLQWIGFRGEVPSFGASFVKDCGKLEEIGILAEEDYTPLQELLKTDLGEEAAQNVQFQSFADAQALEEYYTALIPEVPEESASTAESVMSTSTATASGTCGENLTWELSSDGTLTISGTGKMDDYEFIYGSSDSTAPWYKYRGEITCVTIDYGITSIGHATFAGCSILTSVTIPDSVTSIGSGAFDGCISLSSVTIPDSVTSIGSSAFLGCRNLRSVTIPADVTSIGSSAFSGCRNLRSVTIPAGVTSIDDAVFNECVNLSSVTIPESVTSIGTSAFRECSSLTSVTIPESVTEIGGSAFYACSSLTSVTIPTSVTSIGTFAFSNCESLDGIWIDPNNLYYTTDAYGVLLNKDKTEFIGVPGAITSYVIPASITSIGEGVFSGCSSLRSVTIPDSVTLIGRLAFYSCTNLTSVDIPASVTSIYGEAFRDCSSLTSVTIPDSVTAIGMYAFGGCSSLISVTIPNGVTSIVNSTFYDCRSLTSVTIPASVTEIGSYAFIGCSSLTDVYYSGSESEWKAISSGFHNEFLFNATIHYNSTGPDDSFSSMDLLALSNLAYEDWKVGETIYERLGQQWDQEVSGNAFKEGLTNRMLYENIGNWKVVSTSQSWGGAESVGFYAVTFQGETTEGIQTVIAYRGSKGLNQIFMSEDAINDWLVNDIPFHIFHSYTQQLQDARDYYEHCRDSLYGSVTMVTGHSLGGALAQVVAMEYGVRAETFNAASAFEALYFNKPAEAGKRFYGIDQWNIRAHVISTDVVGSYLNKYRQMPYTLYFQDKEGPDKPHYLCSFIHCSDGKILFAEEKESSDGSFSPYINYFEANSLLGLALGSSGNDNITILSLLPAAQVLYGGDGNDVITSLGIAGDTIAGGNGTNALDGNLGSDTYLYFKGNGVQYINDCGGTDTICLYGFDDPESITFHKTSLVSNGVLYGAIVYNNEPILYIKEDRSGTVKVMVDGQLKMTLRDFNWNFINKTSKISCPVDVEILDPDQNVVYTLKNGTEETVYTDYGNLYVFTDENGESVKYLNLIEGYDFRIRGVGDGTMDVAYSQQEGAFREVTDVPVTADMTAIVTEDETPALAVDTDSDGSVDQVFLMGPISDDPIRLEQEYLTLPVGDTTQLSVKTEIEALADMIQWSVESGEDDGISQPVITVDPDGNVTAERTGTAYAVASVTVEGVTYSDRCRIDVIEQEPAIEVQGVQLGASSLTTELFSTQYAAFDVILLLEQNQPMISTFSLRDPVEDNGVSVTSARFADGAAAERFDLAVKDDRTLLVVPKQTALDDPRGVAKSYTSQVCVNVDGVEYTTDASLKLTVKKSTPKLKVAALRFNSFYPGQTQPIGITGATVTGILRDESKDTAKSSALPVWLTLTEDTLSLNENAPAKAASGNVYILVETEEWAIPAPVKVPVKLTYKAPGVKLSKTSATFAGVFADSQGVSLKLVCTNKKDTLEDLHVSGIEAPEGFEVRDVDLTDGSFLLKPAREVIPGKKTILVNFSDTEKQLPLTLTVKKKTVALSAKPSTVTLNSVLGDSAVIPLTAAPADYRVTAPSFRLVDGKGADTDQLDYRFENGAVTVSTNAATVPGSAYKLYVCAGGSREIALTIRTLAEKKAAPTLSVKTAGAIDLSFPESAATVTAQFKNYFSGMYTDLDWTVTAYSGKTELGDVTNLFKLESSGGKFRVARKEEAELSAKNSYQLTMTFTLPEDRTCTQTVKLPVKRTAVKLKLSKSSLSLNKALDDWAAVDVTCLTKGYRFDEPVISGPDSLAATYSAGRLTVSTNERTEYGKTYRILLKATELDKAVTLTVKIPAQNRSNVTASLRAAGSIDVIRDGTSITLTPAYKNCLRQPDGECSVQIYSSADKYTEPVTDLFRIAQNEDGQFVITRGENSQINTRLKYRAVLTAKFGETSVSSKPVSLKIRAGSAKLRVEASNAVLYAADRNSRAEFRLVPGDPKLNRIRTVEFRSAADRALFALYDYGNGNYAVGFKDGEVDRSLLGKTSRSLTLEITLDGNGSPGAKISTTLKLRLVPYA